MNSPLRSKAGDRVVVSPDAVKRMSVLVLVMLVLLLLLLLQLLLLLLLLLLLMLHRVQLLVNLMLRGEEVEAVVVQPGQPVEIPVQIREGHLVEGEQGPPVAAVEQVSPRTGSAAVDVGVGVAGGGDERGGACDCGVVGRVEVVGVGEELLEHVLGAAVEEALGGGVHEGGHVLHLLARGAPSPAPAPDNPPAAPHPRPVAGFHRHVYKSRLGHRLVMLVADQHGVC